MLLWSGDVLLVYAVLGFALLALRRLGDRALLRPDRRLPCSSRRSAEVARGRALFDRHRAPSPPFQYQQFEASNDLAFGHGSFGDAVRETARVFVWSYTLAARPV